MECIIWRIPSSIIRNSAFLDMKKYIFSVMVILQTQYLTFFHAGCSFNSSLIGLGFVAVLDGRNSLS